MFLASGGPMMNFNKQDRYYFVTLSAAKGLSGWAHRSFAALRMTVPAPTGGRSNLRFSGGKIVILSFIGLFFLILYLLIVLLMVFQAIFNIRLRLYIWEKPEHAWLNHAPTVYQDPCLSFTILLPAKNDERVYRETIQKVYDLNYPKELLQIIAICREDDPGTIAEAQAKIDELGDPNVQLLIYNDYPITKPHGLNLGLQVARGDVVTIFDAEA